MAAVQPDWIQLGFWALVTGGTPLVLLAVPYVAHRISDRGFHLMLGVSAGILGGLATIDILPKAFETAAGIPELMPHAVPIGIASGFFLMFVVERHLLTPKGGSHSHFEDGKPIQSFATLAAGALHQRPDGFAALMVGLASGASRRRTLTYVLATAIDTPLGIVLGVLFLSAGTFWLPVGLGFSAGTFLFVSAADIIPELQHRSRSFLVTASILIGFVIVLGLSFIPEG